MAGTGLMVDLWLVDETSVSESTLAELGASLTDDELARADRYRRPGDRRRSIVSRGLLRAALSARSPEIAASAWRFEATDRGQPVTDMTPLHFNVSHTPGLVAVAIAGERVGVDVESTTRGTDIVSVGKRWFHADEYEQIVASSPPDRVAFFEFWTLKEAYAKALGMGLAVPFTSIRFDRSAPIRLDREGRVVEGWTFRLLPEEPYRVAVAVEARDVRIDVHRRLPGDPE